MKVCRIFLFNIFFLPLCSLAQTCDCPKEFTHIRQFMETNYAGFKDKVSSLFDKAEYVRMTNLLEKETKKKNAGEKCLFIITRYLDFFKDEHIQVSANFGSVKPDTSFIPFKETIQLTGDKISKLKSSVTTEGIYYFRFDTAYRIALVRDKTPLRDYAGVIVDSKLPSWKKGMVKFEAKKVNDSLLKGVLYLRNHMPKVEWFFLGGNTIGGDWQREGTEQVKNQNSGYQPVTSGKLSDSTFCIKISNFNPSNARNIDSVIKASQTALETMPNLVLDLRDNGGGADFSYLPLLPYLYTNPVKTIGVDVLSTDANINGWKKILEDEDIPEQSKKSIREMIAKMEAGKGRLVNIAEDEIDSSFKVLPTPRKVVILINKGCASTTEQFLLFARQSKKVVLLGENTQGVLDYSNMRDSSFSCMPYILHYATTRSRRLDIKEGIDNTGIRPDKYLPAGSDWIAEALKEFE